MVGFDRLTAGDRPETGVSVRPGGMAERRAEVRAWKLRMRPLRAAVLTGGAAMAGYVITYSLLGRCPGLAEDAALAYLAGAGSSVPTFMLRGGRTLIPLWAMMGFSGLCCFGGAVAAGLLLWEGLCGGAGLCALIRAAGVMPDAVPRGVILVFAVRLLLLLSLSVYHSLVSRRTADSLADPACQLPPGARGLSPLMLRHLRVTLAVGIAGVVIHTLCAAGMVHTLTGM